MLGILLAITIAVFGVLLNIVRDQPISVKKASVKLGDPRYDLETIISPVATGWKLQTLSYLLSESPVAGVLRRYLLNKNEFYKLRELSAQIKNTPPLHHPVKRVPIKEVADIQNSTRASLYEQLVESMQSSMDKRSADFNFDHPRRTVRQYHQQYMNGLKPSDVISNTLLRIEEWKEEHKLIIFAKILPDQVMKAALQSDERYAKGKPLSMLDGVPIAIKDMIHVKDHTSYNGKSPLKRHRTGHVEPKDDDVMVRRLRAAGAIILGTTVMTEGGVTPLGWSAHFQGPYNVYNFDRYCGGSSSGSAVAVASGLVPAAIGFDGGGSIRIPASMSGIQGLGTTFGRLPFDTGLETTMIKGGPMTSTAEDAAVIYSVIAENLKGHFYSKIYDGDLHGPPPPL